MPSAENAVTYYWRLLVAERAAERWRDARHRPAVTGFTPDRKTLVPTLRYRPPPSRAATPGGARRLAT